jgi:hypothetical protein
MQTLYMILSVFKEQKLKSQILIKNVSVINCLFFFTSRQNNKNTFHKQIIVICLVCRHFFLLLGGNKLK